jgi:hypothetical protein
MFSRFSRSLPELGNGARSFIGAHYADMLAQTDHTVTGNVDPEMRQVIEASLVNINPNSTDIALATYMGKHIHEWIKGGNLAKDIEEVNPSEVRTRDAIADILRKGIRYAKWANKHGVGSLTEADRPFSPKVVAGSYVVGLMGEYNYKDWSEVKGLARAIQLSPAEKERLPAYRA